MKYEEALLLLDGGVFFSFLSSTGSAACALVMEWSWMSEGGLFFCDGACIRLTQNCSV